MKLKLMSIGLLIVVIVVLVGLASSGYLTSPYFEEKASFGTWGQEITVMYEDGTSESLAVLMNKPLSVVTYSGHSITGFEYKLKVKASGTEFTDATVTLGNYKLNVKIVSSTGVKGTYDYTLTSGSTTIPFDGAFHTIGGTAVFPVKSKMDSLSLSSGNYLIDFTPTGTVTYKGNPDGETQAAAMPSKTTVPVQYSSSAGGTILIDLQGGLTDY